ncbi:DUF3152 domain-containing protein [Actinoplanes regularis]|uniref:DUF3152 domain-containing protein n=1 Tax=Actinoplanes regularis TaxID=52697 RepID=UPI0024A301E9|nr:DUF3152 domain-containing protein [Actinoplanes regularis]GLW33397.1 hypothetical protein Areg01_63350 [Actinoplanes regularis]
MANATNASSDPAAGATPPAAGRRARNEPADRRARNEPTRAKATTAATGTSTKGVVTAPADSAKTTRARNAAGEPAKPQPAEKSPVPKAAKTSGPRGDVTEEQAAPPRSARATTPRKTVTQAADQVPHATAEQEEPGSSGGRHRRKAEPLESSTGRHRMTAESPRARHRAEPSAAAPQSPPDVDPETGLPPGMTRGILELAAERLAASRSVQPTDGEEPEPAEEPPRPAARRTGRSAGTPGLRAPGSSTAGTRPGLGSRPPLASRPPAGPPEAVRPPTNHAEPEPRRPRATSPDETAADPSDADSGPGRPARRRPIVRPAPPVSPAPLSHPAPPVSPASLSHPRQSVQPLVTAAGDSSWQTESSAAYQGAGVPQSLAAFQPEEPLAAPPDDTAPDTAEIPQVVPEPETESPVGFWSTTDHPPAGLPRSVRLPATLPEGLWHQTIRRPAPDDHPTHEQPACVEAPENEPLASTAPDSTAPASAAPDSTAPHSATPDSTAPDNAALVSPVLEDEVPEFEPPANRLPHQPVPARPPSGDDAPIVEIDRTVPPPDVDGPAELHARLTPSGRKLLRRRRRVTFMAYLLVVALVLVIGHELRDRRQPAAVEGQAARHAAEPIGAAAPRQDPDRTDQVGSVQGAEPTADKPSGRPGYLTYVTTRGPILGESGDLYQFRVAVEETVPGVSADDFAEMIDRTLGDERSWIADGKVRLRRIPKPDGHPDFTIYLVSPETSEKMCAVGGLHTEGFTSCRVPRQVIINGDRWASGIPDYKGHLDEYRQYTLNHEVGHEFGHGHEACPGKGKPAPVMQQQTFGLEGCTRNSWPFLDGKRYAGEPSP